MVGCISSASVVAAISAAFLSSSQQCSSFQVKVIHSTGRLSRTSILSSSKTDVPSTTTIGNPTAIELKDSLSSLAAATNRGVSRLDILLLIPTYNMCSISHHTLHNIMIPISFLHLDLIETRLKV